MASFGGLALLVGLGGTLGLSRADRSVLFGPSQELTVQGELRTYRRSLPKNPPERLVVVLHAFGGSGRRIAYLTGVHNVVGDATLVLYPDASPPTSREYEPGWNAGYCCGSGWIGDIADVAFLVALIDRYTLEYSIPARQVFVAGFSNGAMLAMRFASEHPERCGGVIAASGSVGTEASQLHPTHPVPILLMHGERDTLVPYAGGPGSSDPSIVWLGFAATRRVWEAVNGPSATLTRVLTYPEDGHQWHDWRLADVWHGKPAASLELRRFLDDVGASGAGR